MREPKAAKPMSRKRYLSTFSRSARWRLSPLEAAEAIGDYREMVYQAERDEAKLVEDLGDPVQAAWLLTDAREYKGWLKLFTVLAFGLFLCAKWCFMGRSQFDYILGYTSYWYPVWVLVVGLVLSLYWFRRHGQKNRTLSKRLILGLALVLAAGAAVMGWTLHVTEAEFIELAAAEPFGGSLHRQVWLLGELLVYVGVICVLIALTGLVLAKCYDRRWLALYALTLTIVVLCTIIVFWAESVGLTYDGPYTFRSYLFPRMILVGIVGLIGTGVALT